ncbi:hypothetical protein J1N35_001084 [Gossypium stocksii]|uniref:E3 ubiquitin-protein ligase synoviolin-like TPR repeats domain-containing protein n=1 Tax=Gossypium stocksii TaxID=47602 RepID=A0A9D4AL09_9ROSI|nr:hypothetical protein J1N35_001084 [Gossypium stocksii]
MDNHSSQHQLASKEKIEKERARLADELNKGYFDDMPKLKQHSGAFLPFVIPPTIIQAGLWLIWLTIICCLKMFQALGRDRLEHLNASPSVTPWAYFRVFSVFLFVLSFSFFWIGLSFVLYKTLNPSTFLLLFFEPLSITFETMQVILVHGFQLLEISFHAVGNTVACQRSKLFDFSVAGSFWEWKGILIRNLGFFLDLATLIMAVGHYVLIWWLHGMAFHLADAVLFLNIRVNIPLYLEHFTAQY